MSRCQTGYIDSGLPPEDIGKIVSFDHWFGTAISKKKVICVSDDTSGDPKDKIWHDLQTNLHKNAFLKSPIKAKSNANNLNRTWAHISVILNLWQFTENLLLVLTAIRFPIKLPWWPHPAGLLGPLKPACRFNWPVSKAASLHHSAATVTWLQTDVWRSKDVPFYHVFLKSSILFLAFSNGWS